MLPSCDTFKRGHARNVIELNVLNLFIYFTLEAEQMIRGGGGAAHYEVFS